jgi:hypothetical protein
MYLSGAMTARRPRFRFRGPEQRRLERAELENPPLRHLVNCMLVLRARIPQTRLADVLEAHWLEWLALHDHAPGPPPPAAALA